MNLINVSLFSKNDLIVKCHPFNNCFYGCSKFDNCKLYWHWYNVNKMIPLPDGNIVDIRTFSILYNKNLAKILLFNNNMSLRINKKDNSRHLDCLYDEKDFKPCELQAIDCESCEYNGEKE